VRTLGNIARALGHPIPGVAHVHIPLDALVWPTLIHVEGLSRTPVIWTVAAVTPGTVACLGGTCAHAPQIQTAGQRYCRQPDDYLLHNPRIIVPGGFAYYAFGGVAAVRSRGGEGDAVAAG
jgi:hypothetical protein